jgi:hypothetical protein
MNNKNCQSINNNNNNEEIDLRRDSFSDRICDDLCEVLLKFLFFDDKLRFECVSKQFQRCVYSKPYKLIIGYEKDCNYNYKKDKNNLSKLLYHCYVRSLYMERRSQITFENLKAFESVLKKCKFLNEIKIFKFSHQLNDTNSVLDLISENCKHLKTFTFDLSHSSEESIINFVPKYGQKLETLETTDINGFDCIDYQKISIILKNC